MGDKTGNREGTPPFVSLIIPCRDEEKYIGACLDSILAQDYPQDRVEILVVDGMSDDRTRQIAAAYAGRHGAVRVIDNIGKVVPMALNEGIAASRGEVIVRMDAHAAYQKDYVSKCVRYLGESGADNVGGRCATLPGGETVVAEAIALALSHPFGVGNSYFRIGVREPRYVDTVPFGCYRREVFDKFGLFDEDLVRNQDDEFNLRLVRNGGKILLVPEIVSGYYARDTLSKLWGMIFQYGCFKPLVALKVGAVLTLRQLMPPFFVLSLGATLLASFFWGGAINLFIAGVFFYLAANAFFSLRACAGKRIRLVAAVGAAFSVMHFGYGIGYLKGVLDFLILKKHRRGRPAEVRLTR